LAISWKLVRRELFELRRSYYLQCVQQRDINRRQTIQI